MSRKHAQNDGRRVGDLATEWVEVEQLRAGLSELRARLQHPRYRGVIAAYARECEVTNASVARWINPREEMTEGEIQRARRALEWITGVCDARDVEMRERGVVRKHGVRHVVAP